MSTPETGLEKAIEVELDPRLSRGVKAFVRVLNSSGGPPLETLPPLAAREVLVTAQASVPVDLSGIEELEKTITADGYTIKLNVVRTNDFTHCLDFGRSDTTRNPASVR